MAIALFLVVAPLGAIAPAQVFELPQPDEGAALESEELVRRRVEMLLRRGSQDEAVALLEDRAKRQPLEHSLYRRLARLYEDLDRNEDVETLVGDRIAAEDPDLGTADHKMLAEAKLSLGKKAEATEILQRMLAQEPGDPSMIRLVANVLRHHDHFEDAVAVLEDGRTKVTDPNEFAQHLGTLYSELGLAEKASREYLTVILDSPLNVGLMRAQIMELVETDEDLTAVRAVAEEIYAAHPQVPQVGLVLAELRHRAGDADSAWAVLEPLLDDPEFLQEIIQMAMAGLADSRLPGTPPRRSLLSLRLSARMLQGLLSGDALPESLQPRVYDTLNRTLLAILENDHFATLGEDEQLAVLDEARRAIVEMGELFPNSRVTSTALLRLASVYVDALNRPQEALELYERLHVSPNASREQVQLARVGLGRAYIAAGDTARGRTVFKAMGKDRSFREGQGRAHYHLGMLDFMGGHYQTAQERLASVALDAPTADYTNDALDLALLLAEENLSQAPDVGSLASYGRALYYRATLQPDSLQTELGSLAAGPGRGLRDRAALDLARMYIREGNVTDAHPLLSAVGDRGTRYAASALHLKGDLLSDAGRETEAMTVYEQVLLDHEDYVYLDTVRDRVRLLRGDTPETEGELP